MEIQTDQSTKADTLNQLYKALGIVHRTPAAYRPQNQGIMYRYNSALRNMLRCYVNEDQNDWDKYVNILTFVCNEALMYQQVIHHSNYDMVLSLTSL